MHPFEWVDTLSVDAALAQLGEGHAVKAGGIDLLDLMKERVTSPSRLVNIRKIKDLDYVRSDSSGLSIGPLVTLARLATEASLRGPYAAIAEAADGAATPQIRNAATVGGNLLQRPRCWYFRSAEFNCLKKGGDRCFAQDGENQYHAIFDNKPCAIVHPSAMATALVAYDASVELTSQRGKRVVNLREFFVQPEQDILSENILSQDELLTGIRVPAQPAGTRAAYYKQKEKQSFDWPIADVAVVLQMRGRTCERAAIALGAAAPVPLRASAAEQELVGKRVDESLARRAAGAAMTRATPLALNAYKIPVFETIIRRLILEVSS